MNLQINISKTIKDRKGLRPNFVPLGPRALREVSLDSSPRVLYNDIIFEALGPPVWSMPVKCTLAKKVRVCLKTFKNLTFS
jgi:hypothetical protein